MEWISVKDQLPEITRKGKWCRELDHVLCAIKATTQSGTRYIVKEGCYAESGYWRIPGSQCDVVAWMPMPEYEEENCEFNGDTYCRKCGRKLPKP